MADSDSSQHTSGHQGQHDERQTSSPPAYDETAAAGTPSNFSSTRAEAVNYDSDDSMPSLRTISDLSDAEEVDNHPPVTSSRPPSSSARTSRRARVEDDEDEDDQRQTNRQRLTSPGAGAGDAEHQYHPDLYEPDGRQDVPPPTFAHAPPPPPPRTGTQPYPLFNRIALTLDFFPPSPGRGGVHPINANQAPLTGETRNPFGPLPLIPAAFELRVPLGPPPPAGSTPVSAADGLHQQPGNAGNALGGNADVNTFLQQLRDSIEHAPLTMGGNGPAFHAFPWTNFFAGMDLEEPDDPGRAKRLLGGLEEVPEGLMKRMERLGEEDGEMPVCAVCFESLLQDVADEFSKGSEHDSSPRDESDENMDVDVETTSSTSSSSSHDPTISSTASTSGTSSTSTSNDTPPIDTSFDHKVFVLPCAHAFHGSCLRPWFTRPHRTTCPTCRFDIDPDSLTYIPPPPGRHHTSESARRELARARARLRAATAAAAAGGQQTPTQNQETQTDAAGPNVPPIVEGTAQPRGPQTQTGTQTADAGTQTRRAQFLDMPIGFIVDFSMVIPGPRGPATNLQPRSPQAGGEQAQQQQRADAQESGPPLPRPPFGSADVGREPPEGVHRLDDAGMQLLEQIVRGVLGPLSGAGLHSTGTATPTTIPAAAPAPAPESVPAAPAQRATPAVSPSPAPAPILPVGSGVLPALGANVSGGPLPSFDELMQLVEGMPVPESQAQETTQTAQPPPPDSPHQHPAEQGLPPTLGAFISNVASALFQRIIPHFQHPQTSPDGAPGQADGVPLGVNPQAHINTHPHVHTHPHIHTHTHVRPPPPPGPIPFAVPLTPRPRTGRPQPGEKRQWVPPPPPGATLRERVEKKERELGLRCSDISCGLGPSDEDPVPVIDPRVIRQVSIKPLEKDAVEGKDSVCEHTFHPACLVSAERVAGWNGADVKEEVEGDENVEVSCPVCRAVGTISRVDWDEGACALA